MELECEKYKEKMDSSNPVCRHPDDYCQFRSACMIHFMEKENKRAQKNSKKSKESDAATAVD